MKKEVTDVNQLRSFGFLVGGIFALLGLWPFLFGGEIRPWALILAGILVLLAVLIPRSLRLVYRGWMMLGHLLGSINTRIILSVVFYGMFVPTGFIMRLLGKDPMRRHYEPDANTYRVPSPTRPSSHMLRQF
jgi:hypothetical protein